MDDTSCLLLKGSPVVTLSPAQGTATWRSRSLVHPCPGRTHQLKPVGMVYLLAVFPYDEVEERGPFHDARLKHAEALLPSPLLVSCFFHHLFRLELSAEMISSGKVVSCPWYLN